MFPFQELLRAASCISPSSNVYRLTILQVLGPGVMNTRAHTLKSRSLWQARLRAQEQRDFDRSRRGDPPCWTDVTLTFASVVLNLSHLPIPSRAYFERHLFERHLLVGHNRAKGAKSDEERLRLGNCKFCASFFSQEEETNDHIYRLCRQGRVGLSAGSI